MHLQTTTSATLDDLIEPIDLRQTPAEMAVLSLTDSDLTGLAAAHSRDAAALPSLRLAAVRDLRHPMSVDLWIDQVGRHAKVILVRLLGGYEWWAYGCEQLAQTARRTGAILILLPGECREHDPRLAALSTVTPEVQADVLVYFREGGPDNMGALLRRLAGLAGHDVPAPAAAPVPRAGFYRPGAGVMADAPAVPADRPVVPILFYRSMLLAADVAPIDALVAALEAKGIAAVPVFVAGLKDAASLTFVEAAMARLKPAAVVTTTAFASGAEPGAPTLFDRLGVPVLQAIVATTRREAWAGSPRGLNPADLAMHVVMPELDGRVLAGVLSFKDLAESSGPLAFTGQVNRPELGRVDALAARVSALLRLQATPRGKRRVAVLMPDYPAAPGRTGYAVGLDVPASVRAILGDLRDAGYAVADVPESERELLEGLADPSAVVPGRSDAQTRESREGGEAGDSEMVGSSPRMTAVGKGVSSSGAGVFMDSLPSAFGLAGNDREVPVIPGERSEGRESMNTGGADTDAAVATLPLAAYEAHLATLPEPVRVALHAAWGPPADDPDLKDGAFRFRAIRCGNVAVALAPDRGRSLDRRGDYHSPELPPRHALVAFGLWLRQALDVHAIVHVGAHGTLEWLPGKTVALSGSCYPEVVTGALPVIYPFIVSNPGEAAQAKRRIAAVTIGHLPPPLAGAGLSPAQQDLERLVDEYAQADGLDRRRRDRLARLIVEKAVATGLAAEAGLDGEADGDAALSRIDAWLCDLKDFAIKDGLHVYGRAPAGEADPARLASTAAERAALLDALDGRHVMPGPSGAPARGRTDVLPTGRNLFATDPRTMPTATAFDLGKAGAEEVLRLYRQDHGDWPRALVLDLWGSASLRTGGEEIAQGLWFMGCRPQWDAGTGRVTGIEVLPPAALGRPRIDVTLRISGLFRDLFPAQIALLDAAIRAVAAREGEGDDNPLAASGDSIRIFGSAPGTYGAGIEEGLARGDWATREDLGRAYLSANAYAYGGAEAQASHRPDALSARIAGADALVHTGDDPGRDLLEGSADVAFMGGFAAAAAALGRSADLIHLDTSDPHRPRARSVAAAVTRVVRARALNPAFIAGQMRHGPRGASELLETVDRLVGFAETTAAIPPALIEAVYEAYLGDEAVADFLARENPAALAAMAARFEAARARGLWHPLRNSVGPRLAALSGSVAA